MGGGLGWGLGIQVGAPQPPHPPTIPPGRVPCEHLLGWMFWRYRLDSDLTETLGFSSGRPQTVPEDFQEQR